MKKISVLVFIFSSSLGLFAQSLNLKTPSVIMNSGFHHSMPMKQIEEERTVPFADKNFVSAISNPVTENTERKERGGETIIGTTTWDDLPSGQRLFGGRGGTLSAVWTGSMWDLGNAGSPNAFPDRGTFYNYFDGNNWGTYPDKRIENVYCGYPANVILKNKGELIFAHVNADSILGTSHRLQTGIDTFKFNGSVAALNGFWPHATAWEDTVHVIGARFKSPKNNYIHYYRSTDAGQTWDNINHSLPLIDTADCIKYMAGEAYAIDSRVSTVAIVGGGFNNSIYLWKSVDNGVTWDTTLIWKFSVCGMDGHKLVDVTETSDGSYALILDNQKKAHVFFGYTRVSDADISDNNWNFEPGQNALLYWDESMPADSFLVVGESQDRDGDGSLNIGADAPNYSNVSLASMPTVSMDTAANIIYCVFTVAMENTDLYNDYRGQSFRDLFGIYSTDEGKTWHAEANLTNTADLQTENVYPSASKYTRNGNVDVMWMEDGEPGNSLDDKQEIPDGVHTNNIVFKSFSIDDFNYNGIEDLTARQNQLLNIFPNPCDGIFNIDLTGLSCETANISLVNMLGETVKSFSRYPVKNNCRLNADGLGEGMYFIKVETSAKTLSGKIILE